MLTIDCSVLTQGSAALFGQAVSLVVANVVQLVMTNVVEGDRPEQNLNFFRPCPVQVETDSKEVGIDLKWLVLRLVELVLVAWYTWCQDLQGPSSIVQTIGIKRIIIITSLA